MLVINLKKYKQIIQYSTSLPILNNTQLKAHTADCPLENWFVSHSRFHSISNGVEKSKFQLFHSIFNKICL